MKRKFIFIFSVLILSIILVFFIYKNNRKDQGKIEQGKKEQVCFKNNCFEVELAKTEEEQKQGLMFQKSLDQDKGMLFIFPEEEIYSFWMKNTLIPLDIIWINEQKEIVFISEDTQPCKEDPCLAVSPDKEAKYVLEINGGVAKKIDMKVGDQLIFNID